MPSIRLVAEDLAEVGDHRVDPGIRCCGEGVKREPSNDRGRFMASEPVG